MSIIEIFILGIGLSMDAFAVSICKGIACPQAGPKEMGLAGLWFGAFQALMPIAGYLAGTSFRAYIEAVDHWIAFVLLTLIGYRMIQEARKGETESAPDQSFAFSVMLILAVATSIDALAVGITFAFLNTGILRPAVLIGCTTFLFSAAGVRIGSTAGGFLEKKAEIAGGLILIAIGVKILLEHLGLLPWH